MHESRSISRRFCRLEAGRAFPQRAVCTSADLHSRRVEDNTPYLLGSGYADLGTDAPYLEVHGEADQYGKPRLQPRCANGDGQLRNGMRRRLALAFSAEAQPGSAPDGIRV